MIRQSQTGSVKLSTEKNEFLYKNNPRYKLYHDVYTQIPPPLLILPLSREPDKHLGGEGLAGKSYLRFFLLTLPAHPLKGGQVKLFEAILPITPLPWWERKKGEGGGDLFSSLPALILEQAGQEFHCNKSYEIFCKIESDSH